MNILFITTADLNGKLGDSTHVREIISNLSKLVDSILVLSPNSYCDNLKATNIKFKQIFFLKYNLLMSPTYNIYATFLSLFIFLNAKYDIVYERHHIMGGGCIPAKIFKIPYIVEVNGLLLDESNKRGIIRKIMEKFEIFTFSMANKIIVVTPKIKERLQKDYNIKKEIIVIQNGANTDLFLPIDQKEAKRKLKLSNSANYICFVGHLVYWQGLEYLIKSAPNILKDFPNVYFLIVGDGLMKKEWMLLANNLGVSENFMFIGTVPYKEVPLYINASEICVVPKKALNSGYSPLKLYEYMACGKPVVATRIDGFEILEDAKAGLLINPEDSNEFADAIIRLLQNEDLRKEMGENGRKCVVKNHSWRSVAQKVSNVCENVVSEQK